MIHWPIYDMFNGHQELVGGTNVAVHRYEQLFANLYYDAQSLSLDKTICVCAPSLFPTNYQWYWKVKFWRNSQDYDELDKLIPCTRYGGCFKCGPLVLLTKILVQGDISC